MDSDHGSSTGTFDELLTHVIEALGQLANKHTNQIETLSRESAQLRAQLVEDRAWSGAELRATSKADECRTAPAFLRGHTTHLPLDDPLADAVMNEHGNAGVDNGVSTDAQVDILLKFVNHKPVSHPTSNGQDEGTVAIELPDELLSDSSGGSVHAIEANFEASQWTLQRGNHFQLKKIWYDRLEFDRYKLADIEICCLKDARWVRIDGLPMYEGINLKEKVPKTAFKTLEEMRKACQSYRDCVGFAYWPERGWCFPKKAGTGFDPDTATYSQKHKGEIWEWHYMPSRAQITKGKGEIMWRQSESEAMLAAHGKIRPSKTGDAAKKARFILEPRSRRRALWLFLTMVLLGYDLVMMPLALCFTIDRSTFFVFMEIFGAIFWTLDIFATFCTGILTETSVEMRPKFIARAYVRSWFIFDVLLVAQEWAVQAISEEALSSVSLARGLRWARICRLLRVVRTVQYGQLHELLRYVFFQYNLDKHGIGLFGTLANLSLLLFFTMHVIACCWHALGEGEANGWIIFNNLDSGDLPRRYAMSLRWAIGRLHGMASDYKLQTTDEIVLDSVLIFLSLFFASVYAGQVSALSLTWTHSRVNSKRRLAHKYSHQHKISMTLAKRVHNYLRAAHYGGAVQVAEDEQRLLAELPSVLQEDLLFEARMRFIRVKYFFEDLFWLSPRVVQHLCKQACSVVIAMEHEKVFEGGEVCSQMLFITSGSCWYHSDVATCPPLHPFVRHSASTPGNEYVQKGGALAESTLWTHWTHVGTLTANEETMCLGLDSHEFGSVILQHVEACMHAVKYGKRFVWHLNQNAVTDLVDFSNLRLDYLDQDDTEENGDRHFAFISHYKLEAGTEATLLRDTLEQVLKEDPGNEANFYVNPVFVDSENLEDLAALRGHVECSQAMLLLLTPGLLSRPWCLLEIAAAVAARIKVVPVEIQSPLFQYHYPDEEFYSRLLAGKYLNEEAQALLRSEGFMLEDVERAVREVHMKIALPFSPHKSKNVRHAELQDIVRRCGGIAPQPADDGAVSPAKGGQHLKELLVQNDANFVGSGSAAVYTGRSRSPGQRLSRDGHHGRLHSMLMQS